MPSTTITTASLSDMDADGPTVTGDPGTYVATGALSSPQRTRGLVRFDLSGLPGGQTISAADLVLTVDTDFYVATNHTLNLHRLRRTWWDGGGIGKASWNEYRSDLSQAWTAGGASDTTDDREATVLGSLAITGAQSGDVTISLDASLVQGWYSGAFANNGMVLIDSDENTTHATLMRWVGWAGYPATSPRLNVTYSAGGGGGGGVRRQRGLGGSDPLRGV